LTALMRYRWPGNVRELANVIERAVVLSPGLQISLDALPRELQRAPSVSPAETEQQRATIAQVAEDRRSLSERVRTFKQQAITEALDASGGNRTQAALRLGLHPGNLSRMIKQLLPEH
ncbi:MAG: helix-turn-helix domain-containing protein, partial [Myxococcota bacterium]|nr:helix-turn-helix domain-containing protein [Myxococcota bacterium]